MFIVGRNKQKERDQRENTDNLWAQVCRDGIDRRDADAQPKLNKTQHKALVPISCNKGITISY